MEEKDNSVFHFFAIPIASALMVCGAAGTGELFNGLSVVSGFVAFGCAFALFARTERLSTVLYRVNEMMGVMRADHKCPFCGHDLDQSAEERASSKLYLLL